MYVAKHFEMAPEQWRELLAQAETAQVVAGYPTGPEATLLPVSYVTDQAGGLGSLVAHVTRTNDLWKRTPTGNVLAILSGPDSYVMPEWFPEHESHPGVPTWNYVTVHAYGELIVHDDAAWSRQVVTRLSADHGYDVGQVSEDAMEKMLRSVVGIELQLTRVIAKAKLSQNKPAGFVEAVMAGLRSRAGADDAALADAMAEISLPHARARDELVSGIREQHQRDQDLAGEQRA